MAAKNTGAKRVARWHRIIEIIRKELASLNKQRSYMADAIAVVNDNPRFLRHDGRRFFDYARDWYGFAMTAAYRRQCDADPKSASLKVVLSELAADPSSYSIDGLRPFMPSAMDDVIRNYVMAPVCVPGTDTLDVALVTTDLDRLSAAGNKIKKFVDKHVAHTDLCAAAKPIDATFDEIHFAAEECEAIAERWIRSLTGATTYCFGSAPRPATWLTVFDFPWRARRPEEDPQAKKYLVIVHPSMHADSRDPWYQQAGAMNEIEREEARAHQVAAAVKNADHLEPGESAEIGLPLIAPLISVERLI